MTATTPKIPINIYEDEKFIMQTVVRLRQTNPTVKCDDIKVPFDNEGNLLRDGHVDAQYYDWASRSYIKTGKHKVERPNEIFVDAIKFIRTQAHGPRKGRVLFEHPDGRETFMSTKHFAESVPNMVRGWLIGKFKYVKYYGAYGLECIEVMV